MPGVDKASSYPEWLRASREQPAQRYRRVESYFAVHGGKRPVSAANASLHFPAENVAVHPSAKRANEAIAASDTFGAVYQSSDGGSLAVPTGSIYVRFAKAEKLVDKEAALRSAGYCIVKALSYAPNAGWVTAIAGGIACSLNDIDKLDALPGIEEVAPQMLTRAARKE
jgi:hypothetical protein